MRNSKFLQSETRTKNSFNNCHLTKVLKLTPGSRIVPDKVTITESPRLMEPEDSFPRSQESTTKPYTSAHPPTFYLLPLGVPKIPTYTILDLN
jgi:hypothetical protein